MQEDGQGVLRYKIQSVALKLGARNSDFMERIQLSRRRADRLRAVRARVREMISSDETLRKILERVSNWGEESYYLNSEEGHDFKVSLLEDTHLDDTVMDNAGPLANNELVDEATGTRDCQVKISRVTKVHKVACLKHYIKQKRMRRASKQASLKKKIDSIKNLMEEWHRSLTQVTSNQMNTCPATSVFDEASTDSAGYKTNNRETLGSDTNLRYSNTYEDFAPGWCQNSYNNYHQYDNESEQHVVHEHHLRYNDRGEMPDQYCDKNGKTGNTLFMLPEERTSQLTIEGI